MTVVIGANYRNEMLVIADTRVSFEGADHEPLDRLQKLMTLSYAGRQAVLERFAQSEE